MRHPKRVFLRVAILLGVVLLALYHQFRPRLAEGQAPLADIAGIGTLQTAFQGDSGRVRLVLLLSPT